MNLIEVIANELGLRESQVANTVALLDDGNTIPFIARYRKEATGELDEVVLRAIQERLTYLRNLEERKADVIRLIDEQGKLTEELKASIEGAVTLQEVEDLYRPYKQKRRTRATRAKEQGLEPLADLILAQEVPIDLEKAAEEFVNREKEVPDAAAALAGAGDIIAERVADDPGVRDRVRRLSWKTAVLAVTQASGDSDAVKSGTYEMYYDYREPVAKIPPHRILAINRGEKEEALKVSLEVDEEEAVRIIQGSLVRTGYAPLVEFLRGVAADAYKRLIAPSLEREIRSTLTEKAEEQAIKVFGTNLRNLLLQPPVRGRIVMGIDPAYRTGCKVVVVDRFGTLKATTTIYPHEPQNRWNEAKTTLNRMIAEHQVDLVSIGNGTASRETERLVAEVIGELPRKVQYIVVNEAGASVYSASDLAREEFPELDVSMRGAVSIGRRLQDPLAELVKIDPKSIGVGQYQHDVNQRRLEETLGAVVESAVNYVGVELNSASAALLQYVAGVSPAVAKNIIRVRQELGGFRSRKQLLQVPRLGEKTFVQCAGFLRIAAADNPLDNTSVHPESYEIAQKILAKIGFTPGDLEEKGHAAKLRESLKKLDPGKLANELGAGEPTVRDIIDALLKPGRDPRDELPKPIFRSDVMSMEDLRPGMVLQGTVTNVVDFGAFIDIGVKRNGLVHISKLSDEYVAHPTDVVSVGDIVSVKVLDVDLNRGRISLSMV